MTKFATAKDKRKKNGDMLPMCDVLALTSLGRRVAQPKSNSRSCDFGGTGWRGAVDGVELRRPGTSGGRGGGAHLESWSRKKRYAEKQFLCPGLVNGQPVTLITCYLVDVGKPRGEEVQR